jgi:ferredoxin
MCEFCTKHGEGKKWYLNAKNYSDELLSDIKRRDFTEQFFYWLNNTYNKRFSFYRLLPFKIPVIGSMLSNAVKKWLLYKHWGQVLPIEDVEKVLSLTNSITRIPCICRKIVTGKEQRVCFLLSLDPGKTGIASIVDQSYFGGPDVAKFEKVNKQWALDFMKQTERSGMIHTIWTFKAPFIGGLCNCSLSEGCIPMKMYKEVIPVVFRAEHIIHVDQDKCVGCKQCMKICHFNAIKFKKNIGKIEIDEKKCYGCGVCRSVCKKSALYLKERAGISGVSNLW